MPFYEESFIQQSFVNWVRWNLPEWIFTCAPGNARNVRQGIRNKKMGYRKHWPDLFFAEPNEKYKGLFIEFKTEKGERKKGQDEMLEQLNKRGYLAVLCRSTAEAIKVIEEYVGKKF